MYVTLRYGSPFVLFIVYVADIWIKIYSGIARFPCDSMALVL